MYASTLTYKVEILQASRLTPIQLFQQLEGKQRFLLESSSKFIPKGKYSFLGSNPYKTLIGQKNQTIVKQNDGTEKLYHQHILDFIKGRLPKINLPISIPFYGGAVGYIGYDTTAVKHKDSFIHSELQVYRDIIAFDHIENKVYLITINIDDVAEDLLNKRLTTLRQTVQAANENPVETLDVKPLQFQPEQSKEQFLKNVTKVKQLINQGKVDQVVLSQRFQGQLTNDPFKIYCALRQRNPSPYMFYIEFSKYIALGASPESLVQTIGQRVITNPIAGTRPRGKTKHEDKLLEQSLMNDPKEIAEHKMLVDLSRSELLQVCEQDSLTLPVYQRIEKFQSVIHMVSEVHGQLKKEFSSIDALKVCTPAGTVSGLPKDRAIEIIQQLEPTRRFIYGGAIGYVNFNLDLNMALAIRCLVIKKRTVYLQAGAGIVKESQPEEEYVEILHKMASILNLDQEN